MIVSVVVLGALLSSSQDRVEVTRYKDAVVVTVGPYKKWFGMFSFDQVSRPFIRPLYGPTGARMLRGYPGRTEVGEEKDHPHHTGIWFGHGDINDVDIWHQKGKLELIGEASVKGGTVDVSLKMLDEDGDQFGTCRQSVTFGVISETVWFVDYDVSLSPVPGGQLKFGDTKEGMLGVRTHPNLRLTRADKSLPTGHALNSGGVTGKDVWGKRAKWIDYWGEIDGETVGIAVFDHPSNPRHPTWWHAREYGLFAANPFGISAFEGKPAGAGDMELEVDEKITFRYRILLHTGTPQSAGIEKHYRNWKDGK